MPDSAISPVRWLFGPGSTGPQGHLGARWIVLRALGLIYYSAFFSLLFQVTGLIGPNGILPAKDYLQYLAQHLGTVERYWYAPTVFWLSSSDVSLKLMCWVGMAAAVLLTINIWPRAMLLVCFISYLSFVAALQDFSSYQSDGMLLEAGFIALFFAAPGLRPGLGRDHPPSRASFFLLQWEWFRIYFESGCVKLLSGDPQWRHFTAMDQYYQNGPLPTWIGWYVQHLPHGFHAFTVGLTFAVELGIVFLMFVPWRRLRVLCFLIVTPFEIGIILTANYTFLNYLVLSLGFLLLDDRALSAVRIKKVSTWVKAKLALGLLPTGIQAEATSDGEDGSPPRWRQHVAAIRLAISAVALTWIFYVTTVLLLWMFSPRLPLPIQPVAALEPFRIANRYGLFAVMTRARYEIEFQGSYDGKTWEAYPFRYKPQDLHQPPGIYAPYQPRFDWNLWFASLDNWRNNPWVAHTEELLLINDPEVLTLFAGNPFANKAPTQMRAVVWQYWFTNMATKRQQGLWWRRQDLGLYAPALERQPDGSIGVTAMPGTPPPAP
ncbi:MAG TPA: lipase maturation factor family protein [Terriglobales bacterium]|nr:lipase maturation factor family protein [Terriglobales bacterium]